jgi:hypothetical protein
MVKPKETLMKKFILLAGLALVLAGCNKGGTSDTYGTSHGSNAKTNAVDQNAPTKKNLDTDKY